VSAIISGIVAAIQDVLGGEEDVGVDAEPLAQDVHRRKDVGIGDGRRALPQQRNVLEHEGHTDGGDQRGQPRRATQRPVGHAVDGHVERRGGQHGEHEHQR
jgi:hypothetical protein